jgi:Mrp family chromosome partitioning ATPase
MPAVANHAEGDAMKTITVASAKGGSGKSTITSALAVRACRETLKVAMMDLNFDQGSLIPPYEKSDSCCLGAIP